MDIFLGEKSGGFGFPAGPLMARPGRSLRGRTGVPGDKSISHRALILGALARGETRIEGLLESADVMATARALATLGIPLEKTSGYWRVSGMGGFAVSGEVLDFGNAGTGVRLMMGALATAPVSATLTGDESLSRRPMARIMEPLRGFGAGFSARNGGGDEGEDGGGGRLPVHMTGAAAPTPVMHEMAVPSAQLKSALLLAGLNAPGRTTVVEPVLTRDHTERMLGVFGVALSITERPEGGRILELDGRQDMRGVHINVPGDPSSAAFPVVAAVIAPGSEVVIEGVMINPLRDGFMSALADMGAKIALVNRREQGGETVADIQVAAGPLKGVRLEGARAPAMIDEYPILMVAAAFAEGPTVMEGLGELRIKETDRLEAMARLLRGNGVEVEVSAASMTVHGAGRPPRGGGAVETCGDHRIAMAALTLGMGAEQPVVIDEGAMIATSFPNYGEVMASLGADLSAACLSSACLSSA